MFMLSSGSKLAGKEISIPLTSYRGLNVISDKQSHIDLLFFFLEANLPVSCRLKNVVNDFSHESSFQIVIFTSTKKYFIRLA